jgi:ABC-type bacteriocin/lantibiotic exporter with double-glycine peptidase domain
MEIGQIIFLISAVVLTIVLTAVGVYLILTLSELRSTLKKINTVMDGAEHKFAAIIQPLQNLGGIAAGVRTGIQVFETFVQWMNKEKKKHD